MQQKTELTISFNQIKLIAENQDRIKAYETRYYEVIRVFQKNTLMQFMAFGVYSELLDLSKYIYQKDYSELIFDKLDTIFESFEEFQTNEKFTELRDTIIQTINKCNEAGVFNFTNNQ